MSNEEMVKGIQAGNIGLMDRLIEENRGLIHKVAGRYLAAAQRNRALDMDDLLQSAALGIIEAIPDWDENRGAFFTMAIFYMRRSIRMALGINSSKERIENMNPASLDASVGEEEDTPLVDLIVDKAAIDPEQAALEADMQRIVREAVEALPQAHRGAIQHRIYGGQAQGDAKQQAAAIRLLGRDKKLYQLWDAYWGAAYKNVSYAVWKTSFTSATEAAVIRREQLREEIGQHVMRPIPMSQIK